MNPELVWQLGCEGRSEAWTTGPAVRARAGLTALHYEQVSSITNTMSKSPEFCSERYRAQCR